MKFFGNLVPQIFSNRQLQTLVGLLLLPKQSRIGIILAKFKATVGTL